ncbi:fimbrial protein [Chimaeribacter arupi]|uniref:Fimbrial protein n=2 Tax=Yersiniaceae TaxID=1903411 RepID=A0A2N5EK53_9GAMM|nr:MULTISPECIES: fimbrial protein [Yersiniaceae]MBS0967497.1 fimbrial protein [Nissabacter archeti]MDV5142207.1 fimbrial protein [Chimaeribacter arupi]PLR29799.1 fimbrial protein [Chimaeribacter arupi]PLR44454.1 fimbrial protein [Chimaeribacter arupi]PLR46496.1 fimbrial protein [Chimaeribacter arupi]
MLSIKKSLLCLAVSALLMTTGAAADPGQGQGKITFKGVVINAPCSVDPESVDLQVSLGEVSDKALATGVSAAVPVNIQLNDCVLGGETPVTKVKVKFESTNVTAENTDLLANLHAGGAQHVGVRLMQENEQHIGIGSTVEVPLVGTNKTQILKFKAHMEPVGGAPTPGDVEASAHYVLEYL